MVLTVTRRVRADRGPRIGRRSADDLDTGVIGEGSVAAHYRPERVILSVGALAVVVVFVIEWVARAMVLDLVNVVEWWAYATPLAAAALVVGAALVPIVRRTPPGRRPALSTTPRSWRSFSNRLDLTLTGTSVAVLLTTTIVAGLVSSSDEEGRFIYIDIQIPNTDIGPVRPWFYGWSYGVPVLVTLAGLVLVAVLTLAANAARPYFATEAMPAERRERERTASAVARIASGATLVALGGAWRFVTRASLTGLNVEGDGGEVTSYVAGTDLSASFAAVLGWAAPAVEITGFALLLLTALGLLERRHARAAVAESAPEQAAAR
ncbi:hypothetical protein ACWKWP_02445 [Agromyces soli]